MPIVDNLGGPSVQVEDTRELSNILLSGEIAAIYLGGTDPEDKVLVDSDVDISGLTTQVVTNTQGIADITAGDVATTKTVYSDLTGVEPAEVTGQLYYANNSLNLDNEYGTTLQIGQEQYTEVYNDTGVEIGNGVPVYITGTNAGIAVIAEADASTFAESLVAGVTTTVIPVAGKGLITTSGIVRVIDTTGLVPGDSVYLAVGGGFTNTAPEIASSVGIALIGDGVNGSLLVNITNHINLPVVLAYMNGGNLATNTITSTYQDVTAYASSGSVVMSVDSGAGTITTPSTGIYKVTININFIFDTIGNSEESFTLRLTGTLGNIADIIVTVPRNGGAASAYPSISFNALKDEVFKIQIGNATTDLTNMIENMMNFEIESKQIR